MGAEQSSSSNSKPNEPSLPQKEVRRLLNAQRQLYEKKCQEYMDKANKANAAPAPTPQPAYMPQTQYMQQPSHMQQMQQPPFMPQMHQAMHTQQAPQQAPQMQHFAPNSFQAPGLERQRAPYSYARDELLNIHQRNTPTLYPNLNSNMNKPGASATVHSFNFDNNNPSPAQEFVFVNRNGQPERSQPSATAPAQSGRDRSVSRSRNNNANNEVNCPTCKSMFGLQIYQCNSGHSSCNTCKEYHRSCGICGNDITNMRNITLEAYMAERKVPCPNKDDGCMLIIKMADIEFHVKECPFKELQCPLACGWRGKLKQLSNHFDETHPEQRAANVDTEIQIQNICQDSQNVFLVLVGPFNFLFHVKISAEDRQIYMTAQLIGTKVSASKWSYEVHVFNKNECRRKYVLTDVCSSFVEPVADVFKEGRCSMLPQAYATTFVNNGALSYKFFIKQTIESKPRGHFKNQRGKGRH